LGGPRAGMSGYSCTVVSCGHFPAQYVVYRPLPDDVHGHHLPAQA
jgi:hypothetical protein